MPRTNFSPFIHGFKFANTFENDIANIPGFGQVKTYGRCGGMSYTALDYYFATLGVPLATGLPKDGVPLADYIFQRQLESFLAPSAIHFIIWSLYADEANWFAKGLTRSTREDEFPKLQSQLDLGHPQVLGLITARDIGHIGDNHQVVAYGYDVDQASGKISVYIYDNNSPDTETVLTLVPGTLGVQASNRDANNPWRGFFVHGYGPMWPHYLLDGGLVKEASKDNIYVTFRGGKFWVPDMKELKALGYTKSQIRTFPDGSLDYISDAPGDGTLLSERGGTTSYVAYGGAKFLIPDQATFDALGFLPGSVKTVPAGSLASMTDLPRDGTLLREKSQGAIYLVKGGQRRQLPGPQVLSQMGLVWNNVRVVPDGGLASLPDGGMLA
jgi:hypothetical protein